MSVPSFDPDPNVVPNALWSTISLSTRDASLRVPINYLTRPAISVTAACFADNIYDDARATSCMSNILQSGFQRLLIDLYWDGDAEQFYLCPAMLPSSLSMNDTTTSSGPPGLQTAGLSFVGLGTLSGGPGNNIPARQTSAGPASSQASGVNNGGTQTTSATAVQTSPTSSNATLYQIGPYQCSQTLDVSWLVQMTQRFIEASETTLKANLLFLELSLHASLSPDDVDSPASVPSQMPSTSSLIGTRFSDVLDSFIYTPGQLSSDRNNLNQSWYRVTSSRRPIAQYLSLQTTRDGDLTTSSGWPNTAYVLFQRTKRLLLSWGSVDPQMSHYNFSGDSNIFPRRSLVSERTVESDTDGSITNGCLYDAENRDALVVDASWASSELRNYGLIASEDDSIQSLQDTTNNLAMCGISIELNQTLSNQTADTMPIPYLNISQAAVWTWSYGEPKNRSSEVDGNASVFRCALMDITSSHNGRWRVEHCHQRYRAACQIANQPYVWQITDNAIEFADAEDACPDNSSFSIPRTSLESTYLHHYLSSLPRSVINPDSDSGDVESGVWINFNSLDVQGCWTEAGANTTCPYSVNEEEVHERTILVPLISAIVILAVTAITLFVKCNVNRRTNKRRKRGEGGWDYEGVPS